MVDVDIQRPRNSTPTQNQLRLNFDVQARERANALSDITRAIDQSNRQNLYAPSERNLRSYRAALGEVERLRVRGEAPGEILRSALQDGGFNATPRPRGYQPASPDRITPSPPASLTPAAAAPLTTAGNRTLTRLTEQGFFRDVNPGGAGGRRSTPPSTPAREGGGSPPGLLTLPRSNSGVGGMMLREFAIEAAPHVGNAAGRLANYLRPSVITPSIPALQRASDRLADTLAENPQPYEREYADYSVYSVSGNIRFTQVNLLAGEYSLDIGNEVYGPVSTAPGLTRTTSGERENEFVFGITSHGPTASPRSPTPVFTELARNYARPGTPITPNMSFLGLLGPSAPPTGQPFNPIAPDAPGNPQPARSPGQTEPAPQQRPPAPYLEPIIGRPPGTQPENPEQPNQPERPNQPGTIPPAIPLIRPVGGARPGTGTPRSPITPRFPFPGGRPVGGSTGSASNTGVQNSIRTATGSGITPSTNINACDAGGGDPCQVRLDRTGTDTNNRVRDLQDRLSQAADAANAAANAAILAKLDIINAKLGPQIPGGGIGNFIKKMWDSQVTQKIISIMTFVTVLHNAYMLSNNLSQTLFSAFDNILEFFSVDLKDSEGRDTTTSQWVGTAVEGFFNGIFGTETVNGIQSNWKKFNRIYQTASNIVSSFQSMIFSVLESLEVVGNYVALIGNASKKFGVFTEKCYRWMNPNQNFTTNRYFNALNNVGEAVESIDEVTGEALNIQQTGAELFTQQEALKKAVEDVTEGDTNGKASNTSDTPGHLPSNTFESKLISEAQKVTQSIPDTAEVRQEVAPNG